MRGLTRGQRAYLEAHYRHHSAGELSRALGVSKGRVHAALKRYGWMRTVEEAAALRTGAVRVEPLPAYTGQLPEPADRRALRGWDYAVCVACGFVALLVYVGTMGPTVTGEDSGELAAAAYTLGVAHPPGYPLWCMLAHGFTYIPWHSVAWRVALLSGVLGSATVALLALIGIKLTHSRMGGATGALLAGF